MQGYRAEQRNANAEGQDHAKPTRTRPRPYETKETEERKENGRRTFQGITHLSARYNSATNASLAPKYIYINNAGVQSLLHTLQLQLDAAKAPTAITAAIPASHGLTKLMTPLKQE